MMSQMSQARKSTEIGLGSLIQAYHAVGWQVDMRRLNIMGNARRVKALSELWKAESA